VTKVEISHFYSTKTLKAKLLNLIAKRRIARETSRHLESRQGCNKTAKTNDEGQAAHEECYALRQDRNDPLQWDNFDVLLNARVFSA
jgi:hypothetical protein